MNNSPAVSRLGFPVSGRGGGAGIWQGWTNQEKSPGTGRQPITPGQQLALWVQIPPLAL